MTPSGISGLDSCTWLTSIGRRIANDTYMVRPTNVHDTGCSYVPSCWAIGNRDRSALKANDETAQNKATSRAVLG